MRKLFSTLRYLKFIQVVYQIRYRIFGFRVPKYQTMECQVDKTFTILIPGLDCDANYCSRFVPEEILRDRITLLQECHQVLPTKWNYNEANHLWNFNLHYFEYAVAMATWYQTTQNKLYYDKFKALYQDWCNSNPLGKGDAWHPYTISMRIPNLLIAKELFEEKIRQDTKFEKQLLQSIFQQYQYLLVNQEKHILGNHYLENLKAIYLCTLYFKDSTRESQYANKLQRVLKEQILEDGMHFELSMLYHQIILEDLLRVYTALVSLNKDTTSFGQFINTMISKMTECMVSLEYGMGKMLLFNDAGEGIAKSSEALQKAAEEIVGYKIELRSSFEKSGYYKLYHNGISIVFDIGKIGPDYIPGHGHCDALSFELSYKNKPIFVNAGTYQYQGNLRSYFRSTKAHNTLVINGHEQSECWGEHRVGKRIKQVFAEVNTQKVTGEYLNFLKEKHIRTIELKGSKIFIQDKTEVVNAERITSYLHIHPDFLCKKEGEDNVSVIEKESNHTVAKIRYEKMEQLIIHQHDEQCYYSEQFGVLTECSTIEGVWKSDIIENQIEIEIYTSK